MTHDVSVGKLDEFPDGGLVEVDADGRTVIVARSGDEVHAVINRCPHLGFSLTKGPGGFSYEAGVVQCPWHNSRFEVATGKNLDWVGGFAGRGTPKWSRPLIGLGRKPRDLTTVPATVADGQVVVQIDP